MFTDLVEVLLRDRCDRLWRRRIASHSRSSNTRKYIGAVTRIPDIEQGKGEFKTKEEFYTYWRNYEW